ncbi:MAG: BREX-6 system BrxE protein [Bradymonadaceae bacterium]
MSDLSERTSDLILGMQVVVAWAGEGLPEPERLGWWQTDLVDEFGGGDFFERLTPETAKWTSLEAVREAARRTDESLRKEAADPESIRSLYHLGHEVDSQLEDRWSDLKRENEDPAEVLECVSMTREAFDREELTREWTTVRSDRDSHSVAQVRPRCRAVSRLLAARRPGRHPRRCQHGLRGAVVR